MLGVGGFEVDRWLQQCPRRRGTHLEKEKSSPLQKMSETLDQLAAGLVYYYKIRELNGVYKGQIVDVVGSRSRSM